MDKLMILLAGGAVLYFSSKKKKTTSSYISDHLQYKLLCTSPGKPLLVIGSETTPNPGTEEIWHGDDKSGLVEDIKNYFKNKATVIKLKYETVLDKYGLGTTFEERLQDISKLKKKYKAPCVIYIGKYTDQIKISDKYVLTHKALTVAPMYDFDHVIGINHISESNGGGIYSDTHKIYQDGSLENVNYTNILYDVTSYNPLKMVLASHLESLAKLKAKTGLNVEKIQVIDYDDLRNQNTIQTIEEIMKKC